MSVKNGQYGLGRPVLCSDTLWQEEAMAVEERAPTFSSGYGRQAMNLLLIRQLKGK